MRTFASAALGRARAGAWPILQTAVAAGSAWFVAAKVIGHGEPFFAPIAAAVSLSATVGQRGSRAVQMMLGVVLGIVVADLTVSALGPGAPVIALVVFISVLLAAAAGAGLMFVNQAASSAILVVAFHQPGVAPTRLIDALVGGFIALLFSQVLFPPEPVKVLERAARRVLGACAKALDAVVGQLSAGEPVDPKETLGTTRDVHRALAGLATARQTSFSIVRFTRRRTAWPRLEAAGDRLARLDLLATAVLSLMRTTARTLSEEADPMPGWLCRAVDQLADVARQLAAKLPPPDERERLRSVAARVKEETEERGDGLESARAWVVASHVRAVARDLEAVIGAVPDDPEEQEEPDEPAPEEPARPLEAAAQR